MKKFNPFRRIRALTVMVPRCWVRRRIDPRPPAIAVDYTTVCIFGIEITVFTTRSQHDGKSVPCERFHVLRG